MIRIISIGVFFIFLTTLKAQDLPKKWSIKHSPQHFIFNTLRLEIERVISDQKFAITVAPFCTAGDMWNHPDDDILGVGAEASVRLYFANNNRNLKGFYASYGVNYSFFNNVSHGNDWRTVEESGIEMIKYGDVETDIQIHRGGLVFIIGHQFNFKNTLVIDLYSGFGLKSSFSPQKDGRERYDNGFMDYGYNGLDPRIGMKIGFVL
jgi:hypothetical protein